ncbi:MAG: thermonuclease family protein [Novosphingobium sp.]
MASEPETVSATFTRCGPGRGEACVIDGDTFKLGERKIRIVGIDTPEVDARCPQEAQLAEAATVHIQEVLNRGPFQMIARLDEPTDRYGRELRASCGGSGRME